MSGKKTTKKVVRKVVEEPEAPVAEEREPEAVEAAVKEFTLRGSMDIILEELEYLRDHPGFMGIRDDGSASDLSIALSKVNSAIVSLGLARDKVQ